MIRTTVLAAVLLAPLAATAQELPTAPYLPVALATKAADAALQACLAAWPIERELEDIHPFVNIELIAIASSCLRIEYRHPEIRPGHIAL